jgi:hypothetical protein
MTALAAAYAVALSTVLSPFTGLSWAMGGSDSWVLCAAGHGEGEGAPDQPQPLCPGAACAMAGCPGAAVWVVEAAALLPVPVPALAPPLRREGYAPARLGLGADRLARGPPAA